VANVTISDFVFFLLYYLLRDITVVVIVVSMWLWCGCKLFRVGNRVVRRWNTMDHPTVLRPLLRLFTTRPTTPCSGIPSVWGNCIFSAV